MLGPLGVYGRPHVSTAVVSTALAAGLFVPKAERHAHSLSQCRVYRLITVRGRSASVRPRPGRLSLSLSLSLPRLVSTGPGVASSNARTEAQTACTRGFACSHTTATSISIGPSTMRFGRPVVAERPVLRRCIAGRLAGRPGEGCRLAGRALRTQRHTQRSARSCHRRLSTPGHARSNCRRASSAICAAAGTPFTASEAIRCARNSSRRASRNKRASVWSSGLPARIRSGA